MSSENICVEVLKASSICKGLTFIFVDDKNGQENDFVFQVIGCLVNKVASSSIVKVMFVMMTLAMAMIITVTYAPHRPS